MSVVSPCLSHEKLPSQLPPSPLRALEHLESHPEPDQALRPQATDLAGTPALLRRELCRRGTVTAAVIVFEFSLPTTATTTTTSKSQHQHQRNHIISQLSELLGSARHRDGFDPNGAQASRCRAKLLAATFTCILLMVVDMQENFQNTRVTYNPVRMINQNARYRTQ